MKYSIRIILSYLLLILITFNIISACNKYPFIEQTVELESYDTQGHYHSQTYTVKTEVWVRMEPIGLWYKREVTFIAAGIKKRNIPRVKGFQYQRALVVYTKLKKEIKEGKYK